MKTKRVLLQLAVVTSLAFLFSAQTFAAPQATLEYRGDRISAEGRITTMVR